jgi:hypothetical protein
VLKVATIEVASGVAERPLGFASCINRLERSSPACAGAETTMPSRANDETSAKNFLPFIVVEIFMKDFYRIFRASAIQLR